MEFYQPLLTIVTQNQEKLVKINLPIYSLQYPPYSYGETSSDQYRTLELQSPKFPIVFFILPKIYTIISVNSDKHFLMGQKIPITKRYCIIWLKMSCRDIY